MQPLQISEVREWLDLAMVDDPGRRLRYLEVLQDLDEVYLDHQAERAEAVRSANKP